MTATMTTMMHMNGSSSSVLDGNPFKKDHFLKSLVEGSKRIKTLKEYDQWKVPFLGRLEKFLDEPGLEHAQKHYNKYQKDMEKLVGTCFKLQKCIDDDKTLSSVKGRNTLNETKRGATEAMEQIASMLPANRVQEDKVGYDKFQFGHALARDDFTLYMNMSLCRDMLNKAVKTCLGGSNGVADRQTLDAIDYYDRQITRFCDVLADLGLYETMTCVYRLRCKGWQDTMKLKLAAKKQDAAGGDEATVQSATSATSSSSKKAKPAAAKAMTTPKQGAKAAAKEVTPHPTPQAKEQESENKFTFRMTTPTQGAKAVAKDVTPPPTPQAKEQESENKFTFRMTTPTQGTKAVAKDVTPPPTPQAKEQESENKFTFRMLPSPSNKTKKPSVLTGKAEERERQETSLQSSTSAFKKATPAAKAVTPKQAAKAIKEVTPPPTPQTKEQETENNKFTFRMLPSPTKQQTCSGETSSMKSPKKSKSQDSLTPPSSSSQLDGRKAPSRAQSNEAEEPPKKERSPRRTNSSPLRSTRPASPKKKTPMTTGTTGMRSPTKDSKVVGTGPKSPQKGKSSSAPEQEKEAEQNQSGVESDSIFVPLSPLRLRSSSPTRRIQTEPKKLPKESTSIFVPSLEPGAKSPPPTFARPQSPRRAHQSRPESPRRRADRSSSTPAVESHSSPTRSSGRQTRSTRPQPITLGSTSSSCFAPKSPTRTKPKIHLAPEDARLSPKEGGNAPSSSGTSTPLSKQRSKSPTRETVLKQVKEEASRLAQSRPKATRRASTGPTNQEIQAQASKMNQSRSKFPRRASTGPTQQEVQAQASRLSSTKAGKGTKKESWTRPISPKNNKDSSSVVTSSSTGSKSRASNGRSAKPKQEQALKSGTDTSSVVSSSSSSKQAKPGPQSPVRKPWQKEEGPKEIPAKSTKRENEPSKTADTEQCRQLSTNTVKTSNLAQPERKKNVGAGTAGRTRPDIRVRVGSSALSLYNRKLRHDDCVVVPELFGAEEDYSVYQKILNELSELQKEKVEGTEWVPSHDDGNHMTCAKPGHSSALRAVVIKMGKYFGIRSETIVFKLDWYRDGSDARAPCKCPASFEADGAGTPNILVEASFGAEREVSLEKMAANGDGKADESAVAAVHIPQTNNGVFSIGRNVNVGFLNGVIEDFDTENKSGVNIRGRLSVTLWGQTTNVLEE